LHKNIFLPAIRTRKDFQFSGQVQFAIAVLWHGFFAFVNRINHNEFGYRDLPEICKRLVFSPQAPMDDVRKV